MDYRVVLSSSARADIRSIIRYISDDNPNRAMTFGRQLILETKKLAKFPELGRVVLEIGDRLIREIIVRRNYRVVYRVNHEQKLIEVVRFWHAARGSSRTEVIEISKLLLNGFRLPSRLR